MAECRSCGAEIEFGITAKGRRMPLDLAERTDLKKANLEVVGTARIRNPHTDRLEPHPKVKVVEAGKGSRIPHFATCTERRRRS